MKVKNIFQYISYLQYPLMLIALFFVFKPYLNGFKITSEQVDSIIRNFNSSLIFMGLGISFSTLQDTTKTQNDFSKRIWESPKKGKIALLIISMMALSTILFGIYGLYISERESIKELSFGFIVLGIGLIGLLKTAIEMFENHRKDKNTTSN